jgi:dTDP-4-amino-4,6-dideoxygalactose transaminase
MKRTALGRSTRPKRSEFLVFGSPLITEEEIREVTDTLRSGWLGTGPKTKRFEADFAAYTGARHAIALNSCTAGLHLALDAAGIGPGDEVITTPMTFCATANVIVHVGATPVFADVDRRTMNLDPAAVARAITPRTKALLPVHFAGRPCDMEALLDLAAKHGLVVIEDAAHATEARYHGLKVGSIGDMTAFSFYATKNVVTGEGGMLTTHSDHWAERVRIRSLHGLSKDAWKRYSAEGFQPYDTLYPGYKYNMMDLQASLGIHQLARVEANLARREAIWQRYDEAFAGRFVLPAPAEPETRHARHLYTLLLEPEKLGMGQVEFLEALKAENIGAGVHFIALHLHRFYRERLGTKRGDFPNAEWISDRTVSLPLSPKLSDEDVEDVIAAVLRIADRP